ncbi:MAG: HlyD family efflux transporter periplasmic adaptor subunit, partial [Planctomycetota bacterium]|nr:HlyD family efflux transporter periplasmic adaptor subunit [Planctomycetota bacterium]
HGTFLNEGDIVARFVAKSIDEQIVAGRMGLEMAEQSMASAEQDMRARSESDAEKLEAAQRSSSRAAKKLRGYREHEKKFTEESERMMIQAMKYRLENQKDELDQLEKMYSEDELVDATEEIVLKRSRRSFAQSTQRNELSDRRRVYNKEWYEHWREEDYETAARTKAAALERLQRKQEMARKYSELSMKKKRYDLEKQREKFADLLRDKEGFVVRAPHAGILMLSSTTYEKGTKLRGGTTLGTVAGAKQYKVKTSVAEADILKVKSGTAVEITPTANPEMKLMGRLRVDFLPGKTGSFGAEVIIEKAEMRLRPGFTCTLKMIVAEERDAVLVPKTALVEKDGATIIRCAKTKDGPFEERKVIVGVKDDTNAAIRDGLAEGEFVVAPPAEPAAKAGAGKAARFGGMRRR